MKFDVPLLNRLVLIVIWDLFIGFFRISFLQ
jgi:hypothetical protein